MHTALTTFLSLCILGMRYYFEVMDSANLIRKAVGLVIEYTRRIHEATNTAVLVAPSVTLTGRYELW